MEEERGCILTRVGYLSEVIRRTGEPYNEITFALLSRFGIYLIHCYEYFGGERFRNIKSPCPWVISDERLLELILFYHGGEGRDEVENEEMERQGLEHKKKYPYTERYLQENCGWTKES